LVFGPDYCGMSGSRSINLDRMLEEGISEEEYIEASTSLIKNVHEISLTWKQMVRQESDPDAVRRKAREVANAANTLEEVQTSYRTPHPVEHDPTRRENFDDEASELMIKANKAISYANDLGKQEFYEFDEPEGIGKGELCVWEESAEDYLTPGDVLDQMPGNYTGGMLNLDYSGGIQDLPAFEDYTTLREI
jgi:hypothetical protein